MRMVLPTDFSPSSRPFFYCCILLLPLLLLLLLLVAPSSSEVGADEKVTVTVYYETLCPYCADFIVNHLIKLFQTGLISIVNLRMVPWGNAWFKPDGNVVCQHGDDECLLNTIEACTIAIYPDVVQHFSFIYCVERLTLERRHSEWVNCFQMTGLGTVPIDCYTSGNGKAIEQRYAIETAKLNPPHTFVPWLVVNNQALLEDFHNFVTYICRAFKGNPKPHACSTLSTGTYEKTNSFHYPVCYADEGRNLSLPLVTRLNSKSP